MITSREYRQFARACVEWAVETDTDEDRKSFLALAKDWTFAAMAADRTEKQEQQGRHVPLERALV
jgi:hypothetical protein